MITPEQLAASGTEHGHQVALLQWCAMNRDKYPELELLHAIPNGGTRNKAEAAKLKAEGVKAGVSDLFLPVARGGFHGLYLEMKRPGEKANAKQLKWGEKVKAQGYAFIVCDHWEKGKENLLSYLDFGNIWNFKEVYQFFAVDSKFAYGDCIEESLDNFIEEAIKRGKNA